MADTIQTLSDLEELIATTPPPPVLPDLIQVPFQSFHIALMFPELKDVSKVVDEATGFAGTPFYVAGGYFRDKLNRRPFKDVDVFIPGLGEPITTTAVIRYDLESAVEIEHDGITFNLVWMTGAHDLKSILNRMDIGLCQIGRDHDGLVYCTEGYLDDAQHNMLTIFAKPTTPQDFDHIERVKAKYPDMTVVEAFDDPDRPGFH